MYIPFDNIYIYVLALHCLSFSFLYWDKINLYTSLRKSLITKLSCDENNGRNGLGILFVHSLIWFDFLFCSHFIFVCSWVGNGILAIACIFRVTYYQTTSFHEKQTTNNKQNNKKIKIKIKCCSMNHDIVIYREI